MKKYFIILSLIIVLFLQVEAQKNYYFSFESGLYFGNIKKNILSGMTQSGFGDSYISIREPLDLIFWTIVYRPRIVQNLGAHDGKVKYRIRVGHYHNSNTVIEAGFGLTYFGEVTGYDNTVSGISDNLLRVNTIGNYLLIESRINTLYVAFLKNNNSRTLGFGAGPAFSLYKLTSIFNQVPQSKNYLLPGGMVTGFWNFLSKKSWFAGIRTEMSLTLPVKINEMKVTNQFDPSIVSTFKSMKTGALNRSVTINAGIRF